MKLKKLFAVVDDVRSLFKQSSSLPISRTVQDLSSLLNNKLSWALCGGLAVGLHSRPRGTDDVDILISGDNEILYVRSLTSSHFNILAEHEIGHKQTGVSVDIITPEFIKVDPSIVKVVLANTIKQSIDKITLPVVSREGLVAMKLCRAKHIDLADIESIVRHGGKVDLSIYPLTDSQKDIMKKIEEEIKVEDTSEKVNDEYPNRETIKTN